MKPGFFLGVCAGAVMLAIVAEVPAQETPVPPDVKTFAAEYVAAFNAQDKVRVEALYVSESRACITPATRKLYDELLSAQMRDSVPPGYVLSLAPVNEGNLKALASEESFAVKPERELHIDYQYPGTNDLGLVVLWLVRRNGQWMGDFPCLTTLGIQHYQENAAAREHYKAVAAAIREPLRSELQAMIRVHKVGEAETRYQQATGADMRTAMLVINALRDQRK